MTTVIKRRLMGDYALDNLHNHRVDRENFIIYVGSDPRQDKDSHDDEAGVEWAMADRLELNLNTLTHLDDKRPILIHMGTCGGEWEAGMQMFGAILTASNPITVLGVRHSRSMSSLIPLAADRFLMRPPTEFMYHYGTWAFDGKAGEEAWNDFDQLKKFNDMMLRIYVARLKEVGKHKGWHPAKIRHMLEDNLRRRIDCFLPTDEAAAWGFCDGVALGQIERAPKRNMERRRAMMAVLRKGKSNVT